MLMPGDSLVSTNSQVKLHSTCPPVPSVTRGHLSYIPSREEKKLRELIFLTRKKALHFISKCRDEVGRNVSKIIGK